MPKTADLDTLAIHAGQIPDPLTGAVMPPIHLSSTFAQEGPGQHRGFEYSRSDNPTRRMLEHCVAALEAGQHGIAFASGSAASAALLGTLAPGKFADLVIFDEKRVTDRSSFEDPAVHPEGVPWVLVNGEIAVENEDVTGVLAGEAVP